MKMVKLSDIPKAARDFTRTFENEKFRLVRSDTQFEKYALQDVEELQELKNGDLAGEKGRRIAYWFNDIGYGVICTHANFKKFVKMCGEESGGSTKTTTTKQKRTKKTSEESETPKKSGRPKKSGPAKKSKTVKNEEPDLELDFDEDYSIEHNLSEFMKGFKQMAKHYSIKTDINSLLSKAPESENISDLFRLVAEHLD